MDSQIFKGRLQGQNSLNWDVLYIIGKLLERTCLKWACMTHLNTWNTNTKSQKSPWFPYVQVTSTYHWKALNEGYNFSLNLASIGGLHTKLWAPKVVGVPTLRILGLPVGNPETKWHLGANHVTKHKVYYKGEGCGFPQVRVVVSLVNLCLHVARPCTKGVSASH